MQRFKEFHRRGKLIFGCCFCLYRGISITSAIFLLQRTEQVKHGFYRMKLEVWVSPLMVSVPLWSLLSLLVHVSYLLSNRQQDSGAGQLHIFFFPVVIFLLSFFPFVAFGF